ncbi:MAG: DUF4438 domain-containing protein [Candidatus Bathyarchaeia archaeon]
MIETNKDKLLKIAALGEIINPWVMSYASTWDGKTKMVIGMGGINYNIKIGDPCYGWASGDHVEPGVIIQGKEKRQPSACALANLACIGNEAVVVSGDAKGAKGMYIGRHAGADCICWFKDEDIQKLVIGDKVQVKTWGVGLKIKGFEDVKTNKLSPSLLEKMNIAIKDDKLEVPVVMEIPGYLMGSGIGFAPITEPIDYDIQTTCPEVVEELGLKKLRLGDVVALKDQACVYGRGHHRGALTIGVIIHGFSDLSGHGPGVNPILSSLNGKITTRLDPNANIALYLGLRERL